MNFLSKDAPLTDSIQKMQSVLAQVQCQAVFSEEKHPLCHCYSINLRAAEAPDHLYVNGKGSLSEASMASAYGEYIERLQTNNFFIDFYLPDRHYYPDEVAFEFDGGYLNEKLRAIYDPNQELGLEDLIDYNSDYKQQIIALPFVNQTDGSTTYFPLNILSNLYVSNGLATGNSPEETWVQALSEIVERSTKFEIIKKGYALPHYPESIIQSFPKLHQDIVALQKLGYIINVLDASLGGQYPVTAISLINPQNGSLFVSFGAHPVLEVALERTMTELMQGREIQSLDEFETPTFDMDYVADSFNLESHFIDSNGKIGFGFLSAKKSFTYSSWTFTGEGCLAEYNFLTSIIKDMGKEIYLREYDYLGFYSCQMLVPSLSEIYPIDDLIYNNRNRGKTIRTMILDFKKYQPEQILREIESLGDHIAVDHYIGVIFKNNFTMLDCKAQMHLSLNQLEEALAYLEFSKNKYAAILSELIRMDLKQLVWLDYKEPFCALFGKEQVAEARLIIKGGAYLIDTTLHQDYLNILKLYDRLETKKQALVPKSPQPIHIDS